MITFCLGDVLAFDSSVVVLVRKGVMDYWLCDRLEPGKPPWQFWAHEREFREAIAGGNWRPFNAENPWPGGTEGVKHGA